MQYPCEMSMKVTNDKVWNMIPDTKAPNDIHSEHIFRSTHEYLYIHDYIYSSIDRSIKPCVSNDQRIKSKNKSIEM